MRCSENKRNILEHVLYIHYYSWDVNFMDFVDTGLGEPLNEMFNKVQIFFRFVNKFQS